MANVLVRESSLEAIADAIREKLNTEDTYKPGEMAAAIESISGGGGGSPTINPLSVTENGTYTAPSGVDGYSPVTVNVPQGSTPTGTKQISITENGTTIEDVSAYASAEITVNVPAGGGISIDDFISGTQPSGDIVLDDETTTIAAHALEGRTNITSLIGRGVTKLDTNAVNGCTNLTYLYIGGTNATFGNYAIRNCTKLEEIHVPKAASNFGFGGYGLAGCTSLKIIDYGTANTAAFNNLPSCPLDTIILRKNGVTSLTANSLNNSTAFKSGGTGGTVYVPSAQIENYKVASNWSTYYGYGTMTFVALEGSEYE